MSCLTVCLPADEILQQATALPYHIDISMCKQIVRHNGTDATLDLRCIDQTRRAPRALDLPPRAKLLHKRARGNLIPFHIAAGREGGLSEA